MRFLSGKEEILAYSYLTECVKVARNAGCLRSKCGSIIVKDDKIIGRGYNSPAGNLESQRRCHEDKSKLHKKVVDKTCCVHAEHRAITDALRNNSEDLFSSKLYFIRLNEKDEIMKAGKPYCTLCSKFALDEGITEFVLWHEEGICVYDTEEYNLLSYQYKE